MNKQKKPVNLQQLILNLSTDFINIDPKDVDTVINNALKMIGRFTQSDRSYVFELNRKTNSISNTHEWCAKGIDPQIENLQNVQLVQRPWLKKKLQNKEAFRVDDVNKLPKEASKEKDEFLEQDIQSLLVVPMVYNKNLIGLVGFDSVRKKRHWTDDEVELLSVVAEIFTNALIQRSMHKKIHESEEQYRLLVENLNDGIVISQNDKFIYINKRFAEMLGYEYDELINTDYRQVYTNEGLAILEERGQRRENGEEVPSRYETIFKKKDGVHLHVEANVRIINYHNAPATFAIVSDITERKQIEQYQRKLEADLLKRQKASSTSLFADGIVHNIRNTLSVITGRAQLLKQKEPELKEPDIIISNAKKILKIADNFIKKAKLEQIERKIDIDINDLIKTEIVHIQANLFVKSSVNTLFDLDPSIPKISGHYIDYSHAISAIIQYSIAAMENSDKRELRIKTEAQERAIRISIAHTGEQLSDEEKQSVFTPFYSLKKFAGKKIIGEEEVKTMQLFNAYTLLETYRVKFRIEVDAEQRTLFHLTIPANL